ncbi:hypothetical protein FRC02_008307 [Tulasnella sp. 418]|nr:hypothetical protein FRC02_008307 [Tulasnella sp. 418]
MNVTYSGSVQQSKLDIHGGGLVGLQGAKRVIELLHSHASIKHVVLGNNAFGDEGIVALFAYLTTPMASKLRIVEMSLNSCKIGNDGLEALCRYLDGNTSLRKLYLQNNLFNPSLELATTFTRAINNSQLRTLSLTSNPQLSDAFVFRFLPNLSTPYMHELHLSAMGITPISTPYISDFLASDKPSSSTSAVTRVRDLRLNGNKLSLRCVGQIVKTLERYSYSVLHLEIYANDFERIGEGTDFLPMAGVSTSPNTSSIPPSPDTSYLDEAEEDDEQVQTWQHYNRRLVQVCTAKRVIIVNARPDASLASVGSTSIFSDQTY